MGTYNSEYGESTISQQNRDGSARRSHEIVMEVMKWLFEIENAGMVISGFSANVEFHEPDPAHTTDWNSDDVDKKNDTVTKYTVSDIKAMIKLCNINEEKLVKVLHTLDDYHRGHSLYGESVFNVFKMEVVTACCQYFGRERVHKVIPSVCPEGDTIVLHASEFEDVDRSMMNDLMAELELPYRIRRIGDMWVLDKYGMVTRCTTGEDNG